MNEVHPVQVGPAVIGGERLALVAGPCVIESAELCLRVAETLARICRNLDVPYIFKSSFDKANRTRLDSFRGPGLGEGLKVLEAVAGQTGVALTTDIHEPAQADPVGKVVDLVQIPAFLARQTDLVVAAAKTGRAVNIKKPQFAAPDDMVYPLEKARAAGADRVVLTERGTMFGYHRLVNDMRAIPIMRELGCPVVFDATHSVQVPSAGGVTGGNRRMVAYLARAAVACGCDALFLEVHDDPDRAKCDAANMLALHGVEKLLAECVRIRDALAQT